MSVVSHTDVLICSEVVVYLVARAAGPAAATLASVFLRVQSLLDASGFYSPTDGKQRLQVYWSVSAAASVPSTPAFLTVVVFTGGLL